MNMTPRRVVLLVSVLLFGIFIGQNAQVVEVRFLFWKGAASRSLVLLGTFLVALAGGWLAKWAVEKHRESSKKNQSIGST
jgi:putative membrane protein